MSYKVSPWRVTLSCDYADCTQSEEGHAYQGITELRHILAPLSRREEDAGDGWYYGPLVVGQSRPVGDLCPQHARERAAMLAARRAERQARQADRREECAARRAATQLERERRRSERAGRSLTPFEQP